MSRRSWAAVTDFKTRVLRLKPEVQILGSSKSIRHTKVEVLRLKSCFLRKKETKLNANLWKAFSTELFCRRSWWFHVVLLNDMHLACKPRPRSSSARAAMPFVNQERPVLKFPYILHRRLCRGFHQSLIWQPWMWEKKLRCFIMCKFWKSIEFCVQKSVRTFWIKAPSKWTLDCNKLQVQATRGQRANFEINA